MSFTYPEKYDVIVVGGGNAGIEAALAASRMNCKTLLLTHNFETLGQLSCNPSIGGIGKSHLVKEVDAFDGVMARVTDKAGIQFRLLNASKGAAVRATRAQIDRMLYKTTMRNWIEKQPNLQLIQTAVNQLIIDGERISGVITQSDVRILGKSVVLTAGTFLNGLVHVGLTHYSAGRMGDPSSVELGENLKSLGFSQGRLKTGTPARIDGRTIDFTKCLKQGGEEGEVPVFSYLGDTDDHPEQVPCWITNTNIETHNIIRDNLDRSPMYSGIIEGIGPRYCPSIEDKIHRFASKESHQVFLEPEGLHTYEYYPNGISTSLPYDVQIRFIHSIAGLEQCHILRPGYAIEYDYYDPTELRSNLETKKIEGLFFAGQINGTTGYEEAAAQGLFAGINVALKVKELPPLLLRRDQAYLGVMVDDLITKGVTEPYRMFTSRAEYRLSLREDNADQRLTEFGYKIGCVSPDRWEQFCKKIDLLQLEEERLKSIWINPNILSVDSSISLFGKEIQKESRLKEVLSRPEMNYERLKLLLTVDGERIFPPPYLPSELGVLLETQIKYAGYIDRQKEEISKQISHETTIIPESIRYEDVKGLSFEVCQKLKKIRPETIGQATRISGVTPAAISLLLVHIRRINKAKSQKEECTNELN